MSSTSQKHRNFVAEPIGDKVVTELPGIEGIYGRRLAKQGFDKAYVVLGQFLVFRKDEELFKNWLWNISEANAKQQKDCCEALLEWCNQYLFPRSKNMSSTSQEHRNFVAEPIGDKVVTELPGIEGIYGRRLAKQGFDKAYVVLGQFLVFRKDEELFKNWLWNISEANAKQQKDCCEALLEWCNQYL